MPPNKESISERVNNLEVTLWGVNKDNGFNKKINNLETDLKDLSKKVDFISLDIIEIKRVSKMVEDVKKNMIRIFWVILTSSILALGGRYVQIQISDKNNTELRQLNNTLNVHSEPSTSKLEKNK